MWLPAISGTIQPSKLALTSTCRLAPDFWNRGGADGSILQPSTANSVSDTHSLAVIKPVAGPFGEWYSDLPLAGLDVGKTINFRWHEMYSISGGEMRVTVRFLTAGDSGADNHFVVSGDSAGWTGDEQPPPSWCGMNN